MFLSVSTINSMDDVLGSVIVTERLKTRKSLATNYWEDIISGVEVKSNDRNVKNLWKTSTSFQFCAFFHFKTYFNSWKIHVSKNLVKGGGLLVSTSLYWYKSQSNKIMLLTYSRKQIMFITIPASSHLKSTYHEIKKLTFTVKS